MVRHPSGLIGWREGILQAGRLLPPMTPSALRGAYPSDNNDTPLTEYLEYPLVACGCIWLMGQNSNTNHNTSGFCSVALLWNLGELTHWLRMAEALVP